MSNKVLYNMLVGGFFVLLFCLLFFDLVRSIPYFRGYLIRAIALAVLDTSDTFDILDIYA